MILSRYITKISAVPAALAASALLWGCAADEADAPKVPSQEADAQLVLRLALPSVSRDATRSVDYAPTDDELRVSALRILIFPTGEADAECVVNSPLMLPERMPVAGAQNNASDVITYTFGGFEEGSSYKIYVVGNIPHDDLRDIVKFSELQNVLLDYSKQLPQAGNLPMIYEEEADATFSIAKNPTAPVEKTLDMKFACVKMSLNLLFDKEYTPAGGTNVGTLYGENGFKPTAITLSNITEETPLLILGQTAKVAGAQTLEVLPLGGFYTAWDDVPANANKAHADIITPGTAAAAGFGDYADSWLWHHTFYLPENYSSTADGQLTLQLEGKLTDADGNETTASVLFDPVKIGVEDVDDGVSATELPRGSYYEVVGRIVSKELDAGQLEIYVKAGQWTVERDTFEF